MTAANKHLINSFKQITSRAADLRHLCSAFDHNRTLLLEDVEKKLDKKRNDLIVEKELDKKRDDLMNHVSLVWVRLDDALDAHEGTIRDPLKIR